MLRHMVFKNIILISRTASGKDYPILILSFFLFTRVPLRTNDYLCNVCRSCPTTCEETKRLQMALSMPLVRSSILSSLHALGPFYRVLFILIIMYLIGSEFFLYNKINRFLFSLETVFFLISFA